MKIAIGIPAYNCEKSIERAINSVLLQTYQDWHLYIVDDASTDNTNLILSNYAENEKITIIKNDINKGVSGTRNVILNTSDECYVAFLDSDDEWYTSKLEKQVEAIHRGYKIVITDYNFVTETKSKPVVAPYASLDKENFLRKNIRVCFSSVLFMKTSVQFESIGHEDFLFLYQLMAKLGEVAIVHDVLVNYFVTDGSLSKNKKRAVKWHYNVLKMIFKKRNRIFFYFLFYLFNAVKFKLSVKNAKGK